MPRYEDQLPGEGLRELVGALPPKQRQAVTLRYLGDLTNKEIAAAMRTSEEAARRNVFEGLRRLRGTSCQGTPAPTRTRSRPPMETRKDPVQ
jgi:DNA-directed RNA polymerase specialized sigma24 family protein